MNAPYAHYNYPPQFPVVMGTEEETALMVNVTGEWEQPYYFAAHLDMFIPTSLCFVANHYSGVYLQNGGLVYAGGSCDEESSGERHIDNIERATPECVNPQQTAMYIQANEHLMEDMAELYGQHTAEKFGKEAIIRIQRRVVDSQGNRKGCHDNFAYPYGDNYDRGYDYRLPLAGYLATRSFLTGAGYVNQDHEFRFSQKIDGLKAVTGYSYAGYMYRTVGAQGISETAQNRLEIRCSDINISTWATMMRLGGVALLMAALETPLKQDILGHLSYQSDDVAYAEQNNAIPMGKDGMMCPDEQTYEVLDFQERLADMFLDDLQLYTDLPLDYYYIAQELKVFCQDFRQVLANRQPLSILADRADWAAKFTKILAKDAEAGSARGYYEHARDDMLFDYIGITAQPDGSVVRKKGYGYKMRDNGAFKKSLHPKDIANAYYNAPLQTRANIRSTCIKDYAVEECTWDSVSVLLKSGVGRRIDLSDPTRATVHKQASKELAEKAQPRDE
ncbi:MAG: proteasome accessory factor PafA2 family protein [Candidatus Saccharimonadales bacterium]